MSRLLASSSALLVAAVLAGCGGGGSDDRAAATTASTPSTQTTPPRSGATPPGRPSPYDPPSGVPRQGGGNPADPADLAVVRTWVDELRAGRIARAADTFADGARIQNGTPVVVLRTRRERRAFLSAGFPCGARVADAQEGSNDYLVVAFSIVNRVGGTGPCAGGPPAYAAIKVRDGRMVEWYRLPGPTATVDPDATPS